MRIIFGYLGSKANNEDFAITPCIILVKPKDYNIYGLGLCWGYASVFFAVGKNINQKIPMFYNYNKE
jgi:hypothetical protein